MSCLNQRENTKVNVFLNYKKLTLWPLEVSCAEKRPKKEKKKEWDEQQSLIDLSILMRRLVTPSGAISHRRAAKKWGWDLLWRRATSSGLFSLLFFFSPPCFFFFYIVAVVVVCWNKECIISWWICARQDSQRFSHRERIHKIGLVKGFSVVCIPIRSKIPPDEACKNVYVVA